MVTGTTKGTTRTTSNGILRRCCILQQRFQYRLSPTEMPTRASAAFRTPNPSSVLVTALVQLPSQRLCSGTLVVDLHIYGPRFTEQPFFLPRSVRSGRSVFSLFSILVTHLPQWQLFVNYLHLPYCNFRPSHFAAPLLSSLKMRVTTFPSYTHSRPWTVKPFLCDTTAVQSFSSIENHRSHLSLPRKILRL